MRPVITLIGAAVLALAAPPALAAPVVDGIFDLPATGERLALGPDGNMWVTFENHPDNKDVARVTPGGSVVDFDVTNNTAGGIVAGPDGNLWITHTGGVVKFPPGNPTGGTPYNVTGLANNQGITVGPDGNLWAAGGQNVVRIPTSDPEGASQAFTALTGAATTANGIVSGSDGRIWVADQQGQAVVSVTTSGAFSPHAMPNVDNTAGPDGNPQDVAAGPGGQVAYTNATTSPNTLGRLFDDTTPVLTEVPGSDPFGIVFANDGAYWIAQFNGKNFGRLTPDGQYSPFGDFSVGSHFPRNVAKGAGNDLWVILDNPGNASKIARVRGVEPPASPGGPATPPAGPLLGTDGVAPNVTDVLMANAFSVGNTRTPVSLPTPVGVPSAVGTRIRFRLSEAAAVRLRFDRVLPGRRRGRRCVAPRRNNRGARKCTRYKRAGATLRRAGTAGANAVPFSGRISRRALRLGRHRLTIQATDAAGNKSASRTKRFRIVARRKRR